MSAASTEAEPRHVVPPVPSLGASIGIHARLQALRLMRGAKQIGRAHV